MLWFVASTGKMDLSGWQNVSRWMAACNRQPALARGFRG